MSRRSTRRRSPVIGCGSDRKTEPSAETWTSRPRPPWNSSAATRSGHTVSCPAERPPSSPSTRSRLAGAISESPPIPDGGSGDGVGVWSSGSDGASIVSVTSSMASFAAPQIPTTASAIPPNTTPSTISENRQPTDRGIARVRVTCAGGASPGVEHARPRGRGPLGGVGRVLRGLLLRAACARTASADASEPAVSDGGGALRESPPSPSSVFSPISRPKASYSGTAPSHRMPIAWSTPLRS